MAIARIVVGVDGSESSVQALRWAVAEAGRHAAELVAVTTWTALPPPIVSPYVDVSKIGGRADVLSAAEQALNSFVEDARANNFQVAVEMVATEGHPTTVLRARRSHRGGCARTRKCGGLAAGVSQPGTTPTVLLPGRGRPILPGEGGSRDWPRPRCA